MSESSTQTLDALHLTEVMNRLDPRGMMDLILKFPTQCRKAADISAPFGIDYLPTAEIRQVVITALGGSAIGGDFARALTEIYGKTPLFVNRDYTLPSWVDAHTLVIAASYSGNTEETLSAFRDAGLKGAQRAVVSSGGRLTELAALEGVPFITVPGGQPPRSATGFMFFPILALLVNLKLIDSIVWDQIPEAVDVLEKMAGELGPATLTERNPAKQLAAALPGRIPIIYGTAGYLGAVAVRWKGQFNENTKAAAFANVLPEQNHNEALAWVLAPRQAANWSVIFLHDPFESKTSPRLARRAELTRALLSNAADTHDLTAYGDGMLSRILSMAHYSDFVSAYLAFLYGVCPTDMALLEQLKAEMAHVP